MTNLNFHIWELKVLCLAFLYVYTFFINTDIYRNINVFHISPYTYTYIFTFLFWSICILDSPQTLEIVIVNSLKTKNKQIEHHHKTPFSSLRMHGPFIYISFKSPLTWILWHHGNQDKYFGWKQVHLQCSYKFIFPLIQIYWE